MTGSAPTPASTVLLVRDAGRAVEVLLLRRPSSGFAAGVWVFPGGAVDEDDYRLLPRTQEEAHRLGARLGMEPEAAWAHLVAGVRETWEETGILLDSAPLDSSRLHDFRRRILARDHSFSEMARDLDFRVPVESIAYLSRWVTPPTLPRRFDTRFFVAAAESPDVSLVGGELEEARWLTPASALAEFATGSLPLMPPTRVSLEEIARFESSAEILASIHAATPRTYQPDLRAGADGIKIARFDPR